MLSTPMACKRRCAAVALCALFAFVVPAAAGAEPPRADLDGDGVHDRIAISRRPGVLALRLSGACRPVYLRANDFVVRFVVADIDRDGDADVVAETRRSGLLFWINKGRGRFAFQSPHVRPPALRAHPVKPIVCAVQGLRDDDRALNDTNRLSVAVPSPISDGLVAAGHIPATANAPLTKFTHRSRAPRGPPFLLFS
jgi:hypothetical protein